MKKRIYRTPRFKVLKWTNRPEHTMKLNITCPDCGVDADVDCSMEGGLVIASWGFNLVFDPPGYQPKPNFMPEKLKCPRCKSIFVSQRSELSEQK